MTLQIIGPHDHLEAIKRTFGMFNLTRGCLTSSVLYLLSRVVSKICFYVTFKHAGVQKHLHRVTWVGEFKSPVGV